MKQPLCLRHSCWAWHRHFFLFLPFIAVTMWDHVVTEFEPAWMHRCYPVNPDGEQREREPTQCFLNTPRYSDMLRGCCLLFQVIVKTAKQMKELLCSLCAFHVWYIIVLLLFLSELFMLSLSKKHNPQQNKTERSKGQYKMFSAQGQTSPGICRRCDSLFPNLHTLSLLLLLVKLYLFCSF